MDTTKFKSVAIYVETHEKVKELAYQGRRSVPEQMELLIDKAWEEHLASKKLDGVKKK